MTEVLDPEQKAVMIAVSENIGELLARELKRLGYVLITEEMLAEAIGAVFGVANVEAEAAALISYLREHA